MMGPAMPQELTQGDYESLAAFRYALRRFVNFSTEAARTAGLTTQQHQALLAIKGNRGAALTIGALAETLLIAPHTAAELVARLETSGLVFRVADPADRRKVGLGLTAQADDALHKLSMVHLQEVRLLAPRLMAIFRDLDAQVR